MKFLADKLSKKEIYENRWRIHAIMSLGLVLVVMSVSSLNVALPTLVREIDATSTDLQWIVDSYALVFAGLLLFAGAVGDRFGRRGAFLGGLSVFLVATLLATFATNSSQLIAYRAMMGIGAAFVMPATLSIISSVFEDKKERARAVAMWAGFAGASGAVGPIISGLLLKYFWFGSIFFMPVPVILVAGVATFLIVPDSKDYEAEKLDIFGSVLSITGLASLLYGVIEAPNHGWLDSGTLLPVSAGLILLCAFYFWEKMSSHPMLPSRFFKAKRFSIGSLSLILTFFALFGMFFTLVQYQQFVVGDSALVAALKTLPAPASLVVISSMVTKLEEKIGTKRIISSGLLIVAVGFLVLSFLTQGTSYFLLLGGLVLIGAGMGLAMPPATEAIIGAVPPRKAGVGSAVNDTTREVGGALGIAVLGSVLTSVYRSEIGDKLSDFPSEIVEVSKDSVGAALGIAAQIGDRGGELASIATESFSNGMSMTMRVAAVFLVVSAVIVFSFMPDSEKPISDD